MAYRLRVSDRATEEIGEAFDWYQEQQPGLGDEFLAALDSQFRSILLMPRVYAQTQPGIRRALLPRFPYGVFYAEKAEMIAILAVIQTSRSPKRWPRK